MWLTKPSFWSLLTSIVFFSPIQIKSVGTINCLVTHILQNIVFSVQKKKETPIGLEQIAGG